MLHLKQWHYSLHRDFQNCNSTRRSPTGFFSSNSTRVPIQPTHTYSICQSREFSIRNPILYAEDKELFEYYYHIQRAKRPSFHKRNSTHRRQGDLLEVHPCVLQDLPKTFQLFQPFQAFLQVPVPPGNPPHSSILQLECIFYIFYIFYKIQQFDWFLQKTPLSTSWTIQTLHSSKKGRCCDIGQN